MPMTGFDPALIMERSLLIGASRASDDLGRAEDLAEVDLLTLRIVKPEERDLLLVRDLAGEMFERRFVDEGRQRLRDVGRHPEKDVRDALRVGVIRRRDHDDARSHLPGCRRLFERAAMATAGRREDDRVRKLV